MFVRLLCLCGQNLRQNFEIKSFVTPCRLWRSIKKSKFKVKILKVGLSSDPSIRKREKLKYIDRAEYDKRS